MTIAELEHRVSSNNEMGISPVGPMVYELGIESLNLFLLTARVSSHAYKMVESPCITIVHILIMGQLFELNFIPAIDNE